MMGQPMTIEEMQRELLLGIAAAKLQMYDRADQHFADLFQALEGLKRRGCGGR